MCRTAKEFSKTGIYFPNPPPTLPIAASQEDYTMTEATSTYSHPDAPVRHSYPLAIQDASLSNAVSLLMRTMPYAVVRFGVLFAFSIVTIIWLALTIGLGSWLGTAVHPFMGLIWIVGGLGIYGYAWWFVIRYALYLIQAGHIAVLTELITTGSIGHGSTGMFAYGKKIVTGRFGQVNLLFALDLLIAGVVRAFNRALDFIANLLPIPGLQSIVGIANAIVRAATSYIDETIFSYNLARGDENAWRSSKDALIYYCQNSKEILKTAVWVVILDAVLTVIVWVAMMVPAFLLLAILPASVAPGGFIAALVIAALFAMPVRQAFLKPLFLVMVMTKFHVAVRNQAINLEWDERLTSLSNKFRKIKDKAAAGWSPTPPAVPSTLPPATM
jgi:hypothetical protein